MKQMMENWKMLRNQRDQFFAFMVFIVSILSASNARAEDALQCFSLNTNGHIFRLDLSTEVRPVRVRQIESGETSAQTLVFYTVSVDNLTTGKNIVSARFENLVRTFSLQVGLANNPFDISDKTHYSRFIFSSIDLSQTVNFSSFLGAYFPQPLVGRPLVLNLNLNPLANPITQIAATLKGIDDYGKPIDLQVQCKVAEYENLVNEPRG